jgi:hypothetical protein
VSDDTVEVRIVAKTDELTTGAKAAQHDLGQLKVSAADFRNALAATNNDLKKATALLAENAAASTTAATATEAVSVAQTEAAVSARAVNSAVSGMHININQGTREFRALFDELSSGRTRMVPGTLAIIAQRVFGLGPAALSAVGAVAALVGGLAYLAERAAQVGTALDKIKLSTDFAGNLDITRDKIHEFIKELDHYPDITRKDAGEIAQSFARMRGMSVPEFDALQHVIGRFAEATGGDAKKAAAEFEKAMDGEGLKAKELAQIFPNITQAQVTNIENTQRMGNAHATAAALVRLMVTELKPANTEIDKHTTAMHASWANWIEYVITGHSVVGTLQHHRELITKETGEWNKNEKAIEADLAALLKRDGQKPLEDEPSAIDKVREKIAQLDAGWIGSVTGRHAAEAKLWKDLLAGGQLNAKERLEVERSMDMAIAHEHAAAVTARREADRKALQDARHAAEEQKQITSDQYRTDLEIAKLTIEQRKGLLVADVAAHRISKEQELEQLRKITEDEYALDIKEAEKEQALYADGTVEFAHYADQIRLLKQQLKAALAKIDGEIATSADKALRSEVRDWRSASREIMSVEDQLVRGIFSGRQSLWQALANGALSMTEKEIAADLRYLTMHVLFSKEQLAADKTAETGGILVHLLAEQAKTGATAASEAERLFLKKAAQSAGIAAEVSAGSASIMNDAYEAAAGAYKAVVGIPVVGPVLAPIAAGVAFSAVAAFDTLTSAEGGEWVVPGGGLYKLHDQEAVIPAPIANPMRNFFENGGAGGNGAMNFGDIHVAVTAPYGTNAAQWGREVAKAIKREVRNANSDLTGLLRGY